VTRTGIVRYGGTEGGNSRLHLYRFRVLHALLFIASTRIKNKNTFTRRRGKFHFWVVKKAVRLRYFKPSNFPSMPLPDTAAPPRCARKGLVEGRGYFFQRFVFVISLNVTAKFPSIVFCIVHPWGNTCRFGCHPMQVMLLPAESAASLQSAVVGFVAPVGADHHH
jgi:hypothetical protein